MKSYNLSFNEWVKNRIVQENYQPEHTGILKVRPNPTQVIDMQRRVIEKYPEMKPLPEDKLHVTMLHQQLAKTLKGAQLPILQTELTFSPSHVYMVERDGKKSVFVTANEQEALKKYMEEIAQQMGVQIEANRIYHVTLANLTGNVADSVGHSEGNPIMNGAQQISIE
jgi:hypothetical protein